MSITIKSTPNSYSSAHEPLWFVVESTNKAVSGFQYVFDVYKDGELITRQRNSPYGTDKYGVINLSSIVRSYLDTPALGDFDPFSFDTQYEMGAEVWFTNYDVRFGEICGTTTTVNSASGTYTARNYYNRLPYEGATNYSSGMVFLTNRPQTTYKYENHPVVLTVQTQSGTDYRRRIKVNGSVTDSIDFSGTTSLVYFGSDLSVDYSVEIYNVDTSGVIGTKDFKSRCSKYNPRTLIFLNAFGGWDSFTFVNGVISQDNEKKKFEQNNYKLSGFNMLDNNQGVYYESLKTYANSIKTKMKLTSDLLNTDEYIWLAELINSPLVYLLDWDDGRQNLFPVQIMQTNYEMKNSLQNKTEVLEIDIEFSNKKNTQFR